MAKIREVKQNKKDYLDLLLLADEQEEMIDQYLERGKMYILVDNNVVVAECVVTDEGNGVLELKNIATTPTYQSKGYGRQLIAYLVKTFKDSYDLIQVGTGDSPLTVPFYQKCGFNVSHTIPNFFVEHYDHPIYEAGVQLVDMIYLKRTL